MNILVVSDEADPAYGDYYEPYKLEHVDLILSCGDLPADYLTFLATFCKGPVLYVHGNHDGDYERKPPEGCICIENQIYTYRGVRILGLGGSHRYSGEKFQYTDREMNRRIRKLWLPLRKNHGFDILLAHAPGLGFGDEPTPAHRGFEGFVKLIDRYAPKYFIHGHVHLNYGAYARKEIYGETMRINGFKSYRFCYESGEEVKGYE